MFAFPIPDRSFVLTSYVHCIFSELVMNTLEHSGATGSNFLTNFILFCLTLNLSDNLTEIRIVKNSITMKFEYIRIRKFLVRDCIKPDKG